MASLAEMEAALPLQTLPIFVVGAGGIGCELLKNLVLMGFRTIEVIDLDTIDSSNLNRQFLFSQEHVGNSKATTAAEVLTSWVAGSGNELNIVAHHGNVKNQEFDVDFFKKFKIVVNGLDNLSARKHVNRMCMQAGVPLVESGTMGYNGQVQPIQKGLCQCYDCEPKPSDTKTFAVCTIHARPTTMVHCVHYAKEFYARIFGDNLAGAAAGAGAPGAQGEMAFLDSAIGALEELGHEQPGSASEGNNEEAAAVTILGNIIKTLFQDKIQEMLDLKPADSWTIKPPQALGIESLLHSSAQSTTVTTSSAMVGDDSIPTLQELVHQFLVNGLKCAARGRKAFDKDDSMSVGLVAAAANLRASVFHITTDTTFNLRTIAGSIVPAIASTNAVIAACIVAQAIKILHATMIEASPNTSTGAHVTLRQVPISRKRQVTLSNGKTKKVRDSFLLYSVAPTAPNPSCYICSGQNVPMKITLNATHHTLASFVKMILIENLSFVCPTINDDNNGGNAIFEAEEFEGLGSEPLTRWVGGVKESGSPRGNAKWTIGDLNQDIEWSAEIFHRPELHADETEFAVTREEKTNAPAAKTATAATQGVVEEDDADEVHAYHPAKKKQKLEEKSAEGDKRRAATEVVEIDL